MRLPGRCVRRLSNDMKQLKRWTSLLLTCLVCVFSAGLFPAMAGEVPGYDPAQGGFAYTPQGTVLTPPQRIAAPANEDEWFFNFRLQNFAPSTEPLIEQTFGDTLRFEADSFWEYPSYRSCAAAFATNLPSLSVIEYGPTATYGSKTQQSDSYYYQHLHYLKDLAENTTYHYRIITQDYEGNVLYSPDKTFTTLQLTSDVILIPDDFEGQSAPYLLTQTNKKYLLTQDITADTLAVNIKVHNVELDLGGHTIIYDNGAPLISGTAWNHYAQNEEATFGVRAGLWNLKNIKVFNGTIRQGANGGSGFIGVGFNPLFLYHMASDTQNEVAGITVDYYGDSISGMHAGNGSVHHNVIHDRGHVIDDRHQGVKAMVLGGSEDNEAAYNSIRRYRHQGIMGSGNKHHNELYSDSFDTNSFMISLNNNTAATHNKMFGMGFNPVGFSWASDTNVSDNFIYLHGTAPTQRSTEYARISGIAGTRVTHYDSEARYKNSAYEDNVIVLKPWNGCTVARGIWHATGAGSENIAYRRNTVKVEAIGDDINLAHFDTTVTAVDINGTNLEPDAPLINPAIFEDNTLIGNVNLITFGSSYGIGSNSHFYRTRLEKIDHHDTYFRPIRLGYWYWNTFGNKMIDTIAPGMDLTQTPHFLGSTGLMEVSIGNTYALQFVDQHGSGIAGKTIDAAVDEAYRLALNTDAQGNAAAELLTVFHQKNAGVTSRTLYETCTFSLEGYEPATVPLAQLKTADTVTLVKIGGEDPGEPEDPDGPGEPDEPSCWQKIVAFFQRIGAWFQKVWRFLFGWLMG